MNTSVEFIDLPASRLLMKPVDILSHHRLQLSRPLKFGQLPVRFVWLRIQNQDFLPIKTIKFLRPLHKKSVT